MIKILLAEDHQIVRNGIKLLLDADPELEIIAEAANGQQVLDILAQNEEVDIVLADCKMTVMDGPSLLQKLNIHHKNIKILFLSMVDDPVLIAELMRQGASGYLLKNSDAHELTFAIRFAYNGGRYICSELALKLLDNVQGHPLPTDIPDLTEFTSRELEVLQFIAEGLTNSQIAERLFVSKRTIEGHRQSLLEKTVSKNTAVLIQKAAKRQLI